MVGLAIAQEKISEDFSKIMTKILKTSRQIIYFSFIIFLTIFTPSPLPPPRSNVGWTEQGSQDLQRPAKTCQHCIWGKGG